MTQNRIRDLEEEGSNDAEKVMLRPFFVFAMFWNGGRWDRIGTGGNCSVKYQRLVEYRVYL